ncbi:hypothetical protein C0993_007085 [Termitomyces sp. T159_Od127]|nr:hypothetical protein C0993_007085 [Termitomyces sp. T159_Od127]
MVGLWIALFIENGKEGVGPITNVHVKSVLIGAEGGSQPLVSGVDGANVSNVEFGDLWLLKATNPASFLQDLDLENSDFASNIAVVDDLTACQVHVPSTT